MFRVLNNYIDEEQIAALSAWFHVDDNTLFSTSNFNYKGEPVDIHSKAVYSKEGLPCNLKSIIYSLFGNDWSLEEFIAAYGTYKVQVHADAGIATQNPTFAMNIALDQEIEDNYTVFFDNYWLGERAKFVKSGSAFKKSLNIQEEVTDYTDVLNYTDKPFDVNLYNNLLTHIPYENLHGLTVHSIVKNVPGTVITWPRTMLHCGSNSKSNKLFMAAFLNKK
tara:strand:- start:788 stop:1450 length:663 start_codon:yes stop_codon:yes gene_type:complete